MLSEGHGVVHHGSCEFTVEGKKKAEFVNSLTAIGGHDHQLLN
jgi:hypothetical protein